MRRLQIYILFISLLGFTSCRQDVKLAELRKADSLMMTQPDSALILLEQITPAALKSSQNWAEYALLLTQARHKNYLPLTSDSLILQAVGYYKDGSDKVCEAKSYFYLGCTYQEMNKTVSAVDAYLKALRVLQDSAIDDKTVVLVRDYLASAYEKQDFYDEAIKMYKESCAIRLLRGDTINLYYPMRALAHLFLVKEQPDSALFYYDRSLDIACREKDSLWISTVYCDIARVYNEQGKYNEAYELVSKSISCAPIDDDLTINYFLKGYVLYNLDQMDSARHYLTISKNSANLKTRAASYDQLYQLEKKKGNSSIGIVYADSFVALYDSIHIQVRHAEMDRLMDNHELELHKQKLTIEEQNRNWFLGVSFLILCVVVVFVFMMVDRRRKKFYIDLQNRLMKNRAAAMVLQERIENSIQENANAKREQWMRLRKEQFELCKKLFRSSAYYDKLKAVEISGEISDKYWDIQKREKFYEMLRQTFADIILELKTQCKDLTQEDLLYCILILLGYSKNTVCFCMAVSPAAFKMRKSRLKVKMGEKLFSLIFSADFV